MANSSAKNNEITANLSDEKYSLMVHSFQRKLEAFVNLFENKYELMVNLSTNNNEPSAEAFEKYSNDDESDLDTENPTIISYISENEPQGPPQSRNPSGMPYPSGNQSMEGMSMPMPMPTQATAYPSQPGIYPYLMEPYFVQSTTYPIISPIHPSQLLQAQSSYPSEAISQRPQQAYPHRASQALDQENFCAVPKPIARTPIINPMHTVQPTAPPVSPQLVSEYNYAPPNNYHTPASSRRVARLKRNTQFVVKLTPTVVRNSNFNASNDAEVLQEAIKGYGADMNAIISILSNRNNQQRQTIAKCYKILHGRDLIKQLQYKISGKCKDLIAAMMTRIVDYYVKEIHDSISEIKTDKDVLIIILCTLSNHDIHQIRASYENKYGKSLESDIRSNTSGHFERLLVLLCNGQRDESKKTNKKSAKSDAERLHSAGICGLGTNEFKFNSIFAQRNVHQLRLIFQEYSKRYRHDISTVINREFSGNTQKALLTIVECVKNSALYFAEQLNDSMSEKKTKDQKLIFICVTRSEVDMGDIKEAFYQKYGKTLGKRISENTSGYYKKCLLKLTNSSSGIDHLSLFLLTFFLIPCLFLMLIPILVGIKMSK
ncbi:annexin B9-like [Aphidius gifuensis]|uniref:annexin B9-like n=1 Tax=Aphidius gifuensis TaxID=684658 RepID=UPI001CDD8EFA|nr:annexin B9-like [Aphidius gifuensis]